VAATAQHREIAAVVAEGVVLLEAAVMLLVDDDQAGVGQRREQRRAGADDDLGPAAQGQMPLVEPLRPGQPGMEQHHGIAEAGQELGLDLGGQGDLRHQDQDVPPEGQGSLRRPQVDLGLAAAGDPMEQEGPIGPGRQGRFDHRQDLLLPRRQVLRLRRRRQRLTEGGAIHPPAQPFDQSFLHQQEHSLAGAGIARKQLPRRNLARPGFVH